jgi:hypothetical protein
VDEDEKDLLTLLFCLSLVASGFVILAVMAL